MPNLCSLSFIVLNPNDLVSSISALTSTATPWPYFQVQLLHCWNNKGNSSKTTLSPTYFNLFCLLPLTQQMFLIKISSLWIPLILPTNCSFYPSPFALNRENYIDQTERKRNVNLKWGCTPLGDYSQLGSNSFNLFPTNVQVWTLNSFCCFFFCTT